MFFHEILGHRVEGHRQKDEDEGQTLADKVKDFDEKALMDEAMAMEALCQQYIADAVKDTRGEQVIKWHHKLLFAWCKEQAGPAKSVTLDQVVSEFGRGPEVKLAERCAGKKVILVGLPGAFTPT